MFGTYKIIPKERLIVEYHSDEIAVSDFMESRKIISSDKDYSPDYDLVLDFRDVIMIASREDIDQFARFFKGFDPILGKRKSAYLTSIPNHVVVTTLFSSEIRGSSITPKTFSTVGALVRWLHKKNLDRMVLTGIIDELKTRPNMLYTHGLTPEMNLHS